MNILYVSFSLDMGGAQKITIETAREMKRRGHNVYMASPEGGLKKELLKAGIRHFEVNATPDKKTPAAFSIAFFRLLCIVRKYKIDVMHTIHRWPNFICFFVSMFTGARLIWTDHSVLTGKKFLTLYRDKVISVSNASKRHLVDYFHIPEERITVIRNAVRPLTQPSREEVSDFLRESGLEGGKKIICTIARLTKEKGHEYLLKAVPKVLSGITDAHFIVVGDGDLKHRLMQLAQRLNVAGHIHFLGEREDVPTILAASDVMVLPSLREAIPITVLEAFSLGKPVIATDVGGVKEVLSEGTGLLVNAGDSEGLAQAIISILSDDKKRKEMGRRAKVLGENRFNFQRMMPEIERVYENAIKQGGPKR